MKYKQRMNFRLRKKVTTVKKLLINRCIHHNISISKKSKYYWYYNLKILPTWLPKSWAFKLFLMNVQSLFIGESAGYV